jgi:hypothetical protein
MDCTKSRYDCLSTSTTKAYQSNVYHYPVYQQEDPEP